IAVTPLLPSSLSAWPIRTPATGRWADGLRTTTDPQAPRDKTARPSTGRRLALFFPPGWGHPDEPGPEARAGDRTADRVPHRPRPAARSPPDPGRLPRSRQAPAGSQDPRRGEGARTPVPHHRDRARSGRHVDVRGAARDPEVRATGVETRRLPGLELHRGRGGPSPRE